MNAEIQSCGEIVIVYLSGEIDHHTAKEVRERIDASITLNKPRHLILDYENVSFMDSSGIGLVLGRYRIISSYKGTLEVRNVSPHTKKLFELAGIGSIAIIKEVKDEHN